LLVSQTGQERFVVNGVCLHGLQLDHCGSGVGATNRGNLGNTRF
jgi:hypothetical protein